jgi:hypothetical protein
MKTFLAEYKTYRLAFLHKMQQITTKTIRNKQAADMLQKAI